MLQRGIVTKYVIKLEEIYNDHRIMERAQDLATHIMTISDTDLQNILFQKFDELDEERVGYMLVAETHAGHLPPNGIYQWSPWLEHASLLVNYWKLQMNLQLLDSHTTPQMETIKLNFK